MRSTHISEPALCPMTYAEYLRTPETNLPEELHFGFIVRDGPHDAHHELQRMFLAAALFKHVREGRLGFVLGPISSVALDEERALVVQPDILVVLKDRAHRIWRHVRCAPHIAIEVLSPTTASRDRIQKREWYRTYGVGEYWIVDGAAKEIEVIDCSADPTSPTSATTFRGDDVLCSRILPAFRPVLSELFDDGDLGTGILFRRDDRPLPRRALQFLYPKLPRRRRAQTSGSRTGRKR